MDHRRARLPHQSLPRQLDLRSVRIKICATVDICRATKKIGLERREQNVILKCDTFQKKRRRIIPQHTCVGRRPRGTSVAWAVAARTHGNTKARVARRVVDASRSRRDLTKASESTTSSSCCSSLRKAASSRRAAIASTEPCPPSPEASLPSGRSMDGDRCVSVPTIEKGEAPASLALPARRGVASDAALPASRRRKGGSGASTSVLLAASAAAAAVAAAAAAVAELRELGEEEAGL
eukprot:scaffold22694_cov61-Phaeocystis_antarctica.AAC.3